MGAPCVGSFAAYIFAVECSVFTAGTDECRIEDAIQIVVSAHLFLVLG